jgi:hypothetical protein
MRKYLVNEHNKWNSTAIVTEYEGMKFRTSLSLIFRLPRMWEKHSSCRWRCFKRSRDEKRHSQLALLCSASVTAHCLLFCPLLQMIRCNTYRYPLCSCSGKTFRNLFRVLINSAELRWWHRDLNYNSVLQYLNKRISKINGVKEGVAIFIQLFGYQIHQRFPNWWRKGICLGLSSTRNSLDRMLN